MAKTMISKYAMYIYTYIDNFFSNEMNGGYLDRMMKKKTLTQQLIPMCLMYQ